MLLDRLGTGLSVTCGRVLAPPPIPAPATLYLLGVVLLAWKSVERQTIKYSINRNDSEDFK